MGSTPITSTKDSGPPPIPSRAGARRRCRSCGWSRSFAGVHHHLAQLNVARLRAPLDHSDSADFVAGLDSINALAEASAGFVWRLTDEDGQSSSFVPLPGNDDPLLIVNYSIWSDLESLKAFMYDTEHVDFLRRRREWFERMDAASHVCWWIAEGSIPDLAEAYRRLETLRSDGPTSAAWPVNQPHPPPDDLSAVPRP